MPSIVSVYMEHRKHSYEEGQIVKLSHEEKNELYVQ